MSEKPADQLEGRSASSAHRNHEVNFFKPASPHARANMKLIGVLVFIWVVAVFGFQMLLVILQKPVPEDNFTTFETVWPAIVNGSATQADQQMFARSALAVLGKNIVLQPEHKTVLAESLSATVASLLAEEERSAFLARLASGDAAGAAQSAAAAIGLSDQGFDQIMTALLPTSLVAVDSAGLSSANMAALPGIMELYLIHNRSVLTDFTFLGFPFHYWYTAQFLLILFVLLCLFYAVAIENINAKHGFIEQ